MRFCPSCGGSFGTFSWLCPVCEIHYLKNLRWRHRSLHDNIDHYYLFDWKRDDHLSPLVHSLKGGGHRGAIQELVFSFPKDLEIPIVYYPKGKSKDHAWVLAASIGSMLGGTPCGLIRKTTRKQAFLARNERQTLQFVSVGKPPLRTLFVDDIVTTGSTALAAYRALGQPAKMTVWSLFYRNRL